MQEIDADIAKLDAKREAKEKEAAANEQARLIKEEQEAAQKALEEAERQVKGFTSQIEY